jgi:hypothetical protein
MADKVGLLVFGLGKMSRSHVGAHHKKPGFEIVDFTSRSSKPGSDPDELKGDLLLQDIDAAPTTRKPDTLSIKRLMPNAPSRR